LTFALCLLPFALCPLPFAFCPLPFAFCLLPFAFCPLILPFDFCLLPLTFYFLLFTLIKVFLLDNYDSFTYNLVHYLERSGIAEVTVKRNDETSLEEISAFDRIVLSPGPGLPSEAGILKDVISEFAGKKPILGVCLGLQAIAEVFGGSLVNLQNVHHGLAEKLIVTGNDPIYLDMPKEMLVGRYHSWAMDIEKVPDCLEITGRDLNNEIMSIRHRSLNICGVQFHPESILTEHGQKMIDNWLKYS
jgi:anthranilate synthase component 2